MCDAYTVFKKQRHFGSLDGLRAISILAVIWHHCHTFSDQSWNISAAGAQGVTLFFAISGFLIVTLLLRERDAHGAIQLSKFYARRALRISPLYYLVLCLYVVVVWVFERHTKPGLEFFNNLLYFATYTSNWFVSLEGRVIFYFVWSLAVEEQFYMVWPWVERYFTSKTAFIAMAVVVLMVGVWQLFSSTGVAMAAKLPLAIGGGVLLAHGLHSKRGFALVWAVLGWRWCSAAMAVLCLVLLAYPFGGSSVLASFAFVLLVGACVIREDHGLAWSLKWSPLVYIGTISYGMYLLHMLSKNAVQRIGGAVIGSHLPDNVLFAATVAVSIGAATVSFRYFEKPFLRIKSRFNS